jgi:pimeloyl-ACP methyl ester carboxylesterase
MHLETHVHFKYPLRLDAFCIHRHSFFPACLMSLRFLILALLISFRIAAQNDSTRFISDYDTLSITLENVRYPHPVKFISLAIGAEDVRMAYMDVKPKTRANGKTVLLLHGKNFGGYYWKDVISVLVKNGYRVVVPDQIGFGRSSKPFINYSFHMLASQTRKLLDSLDVESATVIGHSMGGMLATRFALMYPQKVEKLILENPIGLEDYKLFVPYVSQEEQYKAELRTTSESIKRYYQSSYFPEWKPEYDYLVSIGAGVVNSAEFPRYAKVAAMTYMMIYEQPVLYEFSALDVPVVLMIGVKDRTVVGKDKLAPELKAAYGNYEKLGKQTAGKIKRARLIEFNAGHIPHVERPQEFVDELLMAMK